MSPTSLQRHERVEDFSLAMKKKEMIFFLVLSLVTSNASITINLNENNGNELTPSTKFKQGKSERKV